MLSSLLNPASKRRNSIVALDLGQQTTKAVQIQRKGANLELVDCSMQVAPPAENLNATSLAQHLKLVCGDLGMTTKRLALVIGVHDSLVRQAEMPMVPVGDMRL